jgi:hypothetical protein
MEPAVSAAAEAAGLFLRLPSFQFPEPGLEQFSVLPENLD